MSDALYGGRRFRTLNILDEGVREALKIVIDTSIPSGRLVRELEQLVAWRGPPQAIRCDNGPEICAQAFVDWCRCGFRSNPITESGASRSPIPIQPDH